MTTKLWYQDPTVLLSNIDQFIPDKDLNRFEKINAIARLAILFALIIIIFKQETQLIYISAFLLLISLFLGTSENFTSTDLSLNSPDKNCTKPTEDNPFANYTIGDLIENKERNKACNYNDVKQDIRKKFRSKTHNDLSDIWGQFITDRNFYSTPNTNIVNDQEGLAKWLFGKSGECKTEGKNCIMWTDPSYQKGRIIPYTDSY